MSDAINYHSDPCPEPSLSSSMAHVLVTKSPLHAWTLHPKLGGLRRKQTADMAMGTIIHAILLGEGGAGIDVIDADDFRKSDAKAARDESLANGRTPITRGKFQAAQLVADELIERLRALGRWPLVGERERVIRWQTEGIWCRSMLDLLDVSNGRALITDLKTTDNASPRSIQRSMVTYGYDIQRATYTEAVASLHPELVGRIEFEFLFFELEPPYAVTPAVVAGTMAELGERRWERAKQTWRECLTSGKWPGYSGDLPYRIEAPAWALSEEMERAYGTEL